MIKWDAVFENERRQFENMSEADRFIYFLLLQFGSPYGWGKENPEASDCSGAVCMALYAATGLLIRTTADDLYRRVFTKANPRPGDVRAAFFIADSDRKHGDREVTARSAIHVAGMVAGNVIVNSQEGGVRVRSLDELSRWFWKDGCTTAVRGLNREALAKLAGEGKTRYGLDGEFAIYFDVGGMT